MRFARRKLTTFIIVSAGLVLSTATDVRSQDGHAWSITDGSGAYDVPFVPGVVTYELRLECCRWGSGIGVSAAEFDLVSTNPANVVLAFTPRNGFLNAGGTTDLRLAVAGCPCGPVLAGEILMLQIAPGSLCIGPSSNGIKATTNCQGDSWEIAWQGLLFGGEYCGEGTDNLCGILDLAQPCCLPDGTCQYVNPIDGCPGVWTPIPCQYYDCGPTSTRPESWGRTKGRYR